MLMSSYLEKGTYFIYIHKKPQVLIRCSISLNPPIYPPIVYLFFFLSTHLFFFLSFLFLDGWLFNNTTEHVSWPEVKFWPNSLRLSWLWGGNQSTFLCFWTNWTKLVLLLLLLFLILFNQPALRSGLSRVKIFRFQANGMNYNEKKYTNAGQSRARQCQPFSKTEDGNVRIDYNKKGKRYFVCLSAWFLFSSEDDGWSHNSLNLKREPTWK
jgi:hypothetical protein